MSLLDLRLLIFLFWGRSWAKTTQCETTFGNIFPPKISVGFTKENTGVNLDKHCSVTPTTNLLCHICFTVGWFLPHSSRGNFGSVILFLNNKFPLLLSQFNLQ